MMHLRIPFPNSLVFLDIEKNVKEQLAKVVVCSLLLGPPHLG